ncbi:UDP-glucuronosyltransferase 2B9, partial [Asbolus verrucosus]
MFPMISRQLVYQAIWRELSLKGHHVTVVTPDPLNDPTLVNLTEINVSYTYDFLKTNKIERIMSKSANLNKIFHFMDLIAESELNNTQFKDLIADQNKKFDLILIEYFHPVMFGLAGRFEAPIIGVSSLGVLTSGHDVIGNPIHPVLYPDYILGLNAGQLTIWQKIKSVLFNFWSRFYHHYILVPRADKLARKYFGNGIPYVGDLERNMSMLFLNVNPLMYSPRPNVPMIVEMGQMHIKPVKPLPADLKKVLDEAKKGVIYFSLGSNVKSVNIDEKLRNTIIEVLAELPYTVLWKWESDHLPGKPDNVVIRKWLPQQDVLAHPNIKAFLTQGGLQSVEEAISSGVPLIGMPFMCDQHANVHKLVELGIAIGVEPASVTKDELKNAITEVVENSKYRNKVREVREILYDKPMTGLEKAVWWSEYVIRHKGARHLRSPTADISWFHYLFFLIFDSYVYSANILGVFMFPSLSHQIVYQPIWRELSLRGHQVTVVTPDPLNDPTLVNLTEISVRYTYDFLKTNKIEEIMSKDKNVFQSINNIFRFMDLIAESELNSTQIQDLIADQSKKFDLILVECFHPVVYAFAGRFKAPIIGVSSLGVPSSIHDVVGNPAHPLLYPDFSFGTNIGQLKMWQKIISVLIYIWCRVHHHNFLVPRSDKMARKYFGNDIPYVGDLEQNMSMLFLNVNPLMYPPRPNVPMIVEMGLMHINPVKPLPTELKKMLDDSKEGVIYFSLGSNVKSVNIEEKLRNTIIEALAELPYKVLWKWESNQLPGKPDNVIIRKWLPQQDILAHRNIKAFVTQGGLQSIEEAISREVPLIGMPFMGDQPLNIQKLVEAGIAVAVDPVSVTKDELKNAIIEVAENSKYRNKIKEVRDILYDRPMTGLEKAIWWSEYVIRHKGAKHLRSSTADISWFHYLLLDVVLVVISISIIIIYLCY